MKQLNHARPYAEAAFLFAKQKKQIDLWRTFLGAIARIVEDEEIKNLIKHPKLRAASFIEILTTSFEQSTVEMRNFLKLLGENHRFGLLPEIYELFEKDWQQDQNLAEVSLTFAQEPTASELQSLQAALKQKFGAHIKENISIDASLLSGVIIHSGDCVIDASLKGQLELLKAELIHP